jgi:hypothetical protein
MNLSARQYEELFVQFLQKTNSFIDKFIETESILRKEITDLRNSIKQLNDILNNNQNDKSSDRLKHKITSNNSSPRLSFENEVVLTNEHLITVQQEQLVIETNELNHTSDDNNNVNTINLANKVLNRLSDIQKLSSIISIKKDTKEVLDEPMLNDNDNLDEVSTIIAQEHTSKSENNDKDSEVPLVEQNNEEKPSKKNDNDSDSDDNLDRLCNFNFLNAKANRKKITDSDEETEKEETLLKSKRKQANPSKVVENEAENLDEIEYMIDQGNLNNYAYL